MNWQALAEKLPPEWFQVMMVLAQSLSVYPHQRVETWWHRNGKRLSWTDFLNFLTQLEPVSGEDGLLFQPLFCHLPDNLQKHTLQFIYQHCDYISSTILKQFLQILFEKRCTKVDWIQLYLNLLQNRVVCRKKEETSQKLRPDKSCNTFQTSLTTEYQFSERSSAQLLTICERLRVAENDGIAWDDVGPFSRSSETGQKELRKPSPSVSPTSQLDFVVEGDTKEDIDVQMEVDEISMKNSMAVNDVARSALTSDCEIPGGAIDDEVQTAVLKIRESWLSGQAVDPDVVILLTNLSPKQVQTVLEQMDGLILSDASVLLACQTLVDCASQQISYHNVLIFASVFLLPQIQKLEQAASRLFAAAVVGFVKTFPLHSIEGLFRPLLVSSNLSCSLPHSDLVIKVIREALSTQHQQELLCVLLNAEVRTWTDQMMLVVQSLIDTKVELPSDRLKRLLISFEHNSLANSSNRKFGKLLLSFVQFYGHLLTPVELLQCSHLADSHKTFLSKSIKSSLAKLSKV